MEGDSYRKRFNDHGLEILVPPAEDRALVDRVTFEELTHGIVSDDSRQQYRRIISDLAGRIPSRGPDPGVRDTRY